MNYSVFDGIGGFGRFFFCNFIFRVFTGNGFRNDFLLDYIFWYYYWFNSTLYSFYTCFNLARFSICCYSSDCFTNDGFVFNIYSCFNYIARFTICRYSNGFTESWFNISF
uniref:Uncharacterized protein n=1 Tax=Cacopsylla melanoneura TaxID=428564 RepID=A0A8D9B4L5_9HEMI